MSAAEDRAFDALMADLIGGAPQPDNLPHRDESRQPLDTYPPQPAPNKVHAIRAPQPAAHVNVRTPPRARNRSLS
jgi:hypothetical protein